MASNAFFFVAFRSFPAAIAFRVALVTAAFVLAFGGAVRAQQQGQPPAIRPTQPTQPPELRIAISTHCFVSSDSRCK
jgi:hypothetical protein